jgi:TolB-like protein
MFYGYLRPRRSVLEAVFLVAAALASCATEHHGGAESDRAEGLQQVTIAPFQAHSAEQRALSTVLAESLATRLARLPGLSATVAGSERAPDFQVQGDLTVRDGRLVIAVRLYGTEPRVPVWSGTFWSKDSLDTALISDLAQGLAEAVYGQLARGDAPAARNKP